MIGEHGARPRDDRLGRRSSPAGLVASTFLGALCLVGTASPASAQDAADGDGAEEDAWLGVGLRQTVRCEARAGARDSAEDERAGCTRAFVAEAVVEEAPADRAGVQPGDTVVAVNGRALSRESGRDEFTSLSPDRPAQLLIGRPGEGRMSVRVVPETRPPRVSPERVRVAADPPDAPALPPEAPEAAGRSAAVDAGAPDGTSGGSSAVVVGRDDEGRLVVRWRDGDSTVAARLREMTPRLEQIRDSVFAQARRHIRALREHQREALRRARAAAPRPDDGAGQGRSRPADAALSGTESLRAAGAEFRPLTSGLAEYFPGADGGLLIMEVVSATPADQLGLRAGDVVVEAAGRRLSGPADLRDALEEYPRQDSLVVKWVRKGQVRTGVLRRP